MSGKQSTNIPGASYGKKSFDKQGQRGYQGHQGQRDVREHQQGRGYRFQQGRQEQRDYQGQRDYQDRPRQHYNQHPYHKGGKFTSPQKKSEPAYQKKAIPKKTLDEEDDLEEVENTTPEVPSDTSPETSLEKESPETPDEEYGDDVESLSDESGEESDEQYEGEQRDDFFRNFEPSMHKLLTQMLDNPSEPVLIHFDLIKTAFVKNKKFLKQKRFMLNKQIKEINDQKRLNKQLYTEYTFLNREKLRVAKWNQTSYGECTQRQLKFVPFPMLVKFYRHRFPKDDREFTIDSRTRNRMVYDLAHSSCRRCHLISHMEEDCKE